MTLFPKKTEIEPLFNPAGLPTAGGLLHLVWKFYLEHFRSLMRISLLTLVGFLLTLPGMLLTARGITPFGSIEYAKPDWSEPIALAFVALGSLAAVLVTTYVRAALIDRIADTLGKHGGDGSRGHSRTLPALVQYLAVVILTGFVVSAGFTLFFIPGLIAVVYLQFAEPIVILEKTNAFEAIKRSLRMIHGRFLAAGWRTLVVNGVFALATGSLAILTVQLPLVALRASTQYDPEKVFYMAAPLLLVAWLISALTLPLFLSFQVTLYQEMKKLRS
jgi:hypothetical protein